MAVISYSSGITFCPSIRMSQICDKDTCALIQLGVRRVHLAVDFESLRIFALSHLPAFTHMYLNDLLYVYSEHGTQNSHQPISFDCSCIDASYRHITIPY
jgi:hypothetical protein